jgi:ppGpp synthetase/RelA/SpoT-type nucleotidyltranferase
MNNHILETYLRLYEGVFSPSAIMLETMIKGQLDKASHIDRVTARAKRPDRFEQKARKTDASGQPRYPDPFIQIQDIIGARVVVFYQTDIAATEAILMNYFQPIEIRTIVPDSEWEFGYFGRHFILALPKDVVPKGVPTKDAPQFFELQIKTLFQHAWSEAEHDLGYKALEELNAEQQRYLAFTSAQAWGADDVFQRLVDGVTS